MSELQEILQAAGIDKVLLIDDAYDSVPLALDLAIEEDVWTQVFDDLTHENRSALAKLFPPFESMRADDLRASDEFVGLLWAKRDEVGRAILDPLFSRYEADKQADLAKVQCLVAQLEGIGLKCDTVGRDFRAKANGYNLVFIDLYLSSAQASEDIELSIKGLATVIASRRDSPPLVVLMSSSGRLVEKREEFGERAGLFESNFRILPKSEISNEAYVQRLLMRLADHYSDSLKLAAFLEAWQSGITNATTRTSKLIRKLGLADLAQIHQLLLNVEGEPTGSYLVDVFDSVLQHEIEREEPIIDAANMLNVLTSEKYPPPYIPGSADLQDLVQRSLFQNRNRLKLPGAIGSSIAFGDLLRRKAVPHGNGEGRPVRALTGIGVDDVLAVVTPACDLQRDGAKTVLLMVGSLSPLTPADWTYKDSGIRTPVVELADGTRYWIKWNVKHLEAVARAELEDLLIAEPASFEIVARLRESHALELQQKLLSSLGRVGLTAPMPATFHIEVEAFLPGADKKPIRLNIRELEGGGVCFVGRHKDPGKQHERLILTEDACEAICDAVGRVDQKEVHESAHELINDLRASGELLQALEKGILLPSAQNQSYRDITTGKGKIVGLVKRCKIALDTEKPLSNADLKKAGVILSVYSPSELEEQYASNRPTLMKEKTANSVHQFQGGHYAREDSGEA